MTSIRLKIEESWYASMDCKVQKSGPWVCFYGGHSTGYKLGNHPKNIEPCAHRARTVRAPCAHRATTPPRSLPLVVPRGGGGRHLVNPKFFVAAHCVVVWVTVLWGTATCIPCGGDIPSIGTPLIPPVSLALMAGLSAHFC